MARERLTELQLEDFYSAYRNWMVEGMRAYDYTILFDILHDIEFEWVLPEDANRASEGIYLRAQFEYEDHMRLPDGWDSYPCSFLEFLIALAECMENDIMYDPDSGSEPSIWFWMMMRNCGLSKFTDGYLLRHGGVAGKEVERIVDKIMFRRFDRNGNGGLFPMESSRKDQRFVEFWYQMNDYVLEKNMV